MDFTVIVYSVISILFCLTDGSIIDCSFEQGNLCGYTQLPHSGAIRNDLDWTLNQGHTRNGPDNDHTYGNQSGHYIYFNFANAVPNKKATLISPAVQCNTTNATLTFWYSIYEVSSGQLMVLTATPHLQNIHTVWNKTGNQRPGWKMASVTLDLSHPTEILFNGVTGWVTSSFKAIDDISLVGGTCQGNGITSSTTLTTKLATTSSQIDTTPSPRLTTKEETTSPNCNFEQGNLCGYQQLPSTGTPHDDLDWILNQGPTRTNDTGPDNDHTNGNRTGHYIYINTASTLPNKKATIVSPVVQCNTTHANLTFWYSMYGASVGQLNVYTATPHLQHPLVKWTKTGNQGPGWKMATVTLDLSHPTEIIFTGGTGWGIHSDIAIDDIYVAGGSCPDPPTTTPTTHTTLPTTHTTPTTHISASSTTPTKHTTSSTHTTPLTTHTTTRTTQTTTPTKHITIPTIHTTTPTTHTTTPTTHTTTPTTHTTTPTTHTTTPTTHTTTPTTHTTTPTTHTTTPPTHTTTPTTHTTTPTTHSTTRTTHTTTPTTHTTTPTTHTTTHTTHTTTHTTKPTTYTTTPTKHTTTPTTHTTPITNTTTPTTNTTTTHTTTSTHTTKPTTSPTTNTTTPTTHTSTVVTTPMLCADFYYGTNCSLPCSCYTANSVSCNSTGSCMCKTGWQGVNCTDDVNECQLTRSLCSGASEQCQNTAGSFECVCASGTRRNPSGVCTETKKIPFDLTINVSVTFNDTDKNSSSYKVVEEEVRNKLKSSLVNQNSGVVDVIILSLKKGSIIVEAEVVLADNALGQAASSLVTSLVKISQSTFTVGNVSGSTDVTVAGRKLSNSISPCSVLRALDTCVGSSLVCDDTSGQPVCRNIGSGQSDNNTLKIAVGAGAGGGGAVIIAIIISVLICRRHRKDSLLDDRVQMYSGKTGYQEQVDMSNLDTDSGLGENDAPTFGGHEVINEEFTSSQRPQLSFISPDQDSDKDILMFKM